MACNKWESDGLLYVADELSTEERTSYEAHLTECEECSVELQVYKEMFGEFTAEELLLEEPSSECDAKIISALEDIANETAVKPVYTMGGFMSIFLHRVALPLAIFALAVTVGIKFSSNAVSEKANLAVSNETAVDSLEDSVDSDSGHLFIEGGGDGVIPVGLEE